MAKPTCRWIKLPASHGPEPHLRRDAVYCNAPVPYVMQYDDDENKVRRYATFCPEHQALVDAQQTDEDE